MKKARLYCLLSILSGLALIVGGAFLIGCNPPAVWKTIGYIAVISGFALVGSGIFVIEFVIFPTNKK